MESLVLEREARRSRELGHERGIVEQAGPVHDRKDILPADAQAGRLAPVAGWQAGLPTFGVDPLTALQSVQQLERRIAERVGEPRAQLAWRRRVTKLEDEARQGGASPPDPQPREPHTGGDQHETTRLRQAQRAIRRVVREEAAVQAVDRASAIERHRGDRWDQDGPCYAAPRRRGARQPHGGQHDECRDPR